VPTVVLLKPNFASKTKVTLGGGLDYLDGIWRSLTSDTLYIGVGFIISLIVIGTLIDLR
jgi:hypothetical protein